MRFGPILDAVVDPLVQAVEDGTDMGRVLVEQSLSQAALFNAARGAAQFKALIPCCC